MKQNRYIYVTVFIASFASLGFELTLTRIFSISLGYHFAYMVITIAMVGLAFSGTILTIFPTLKSAANLSRFGLMLGISIAASYLAANQIPFDPVKFQWSGIHFLLVGLYYPVLMFPFFFTGLIIASGYHLLSKKSGILYGFDLTGAGIGSLGILFMLRNLSPEQVIMLLSGLTLISLPLAGTKTVKSLAGFFFLIFTFFMVSLPSFVIPRISPFRELSQALLYPGARLIKTHTGSFSRIDIFESPAVRYAPGLSLKYLRALPDQLGCAIDGDQIMAITDGSDESKLDFLSQLPQSLVFEIAGKGDALVIDPGGGLVPLMARYYGVENIFNVESCPLLVKVLDTDYAHFSGNIYSENTWGGMGRAWLQSRSLTFDIIDMSLTGGVPSGPSGLSENYQLTVEAFQEYINHLKSDGFLCLSLYLVPPPRHSFRLLSTVKSALIKSGITKPGQHIAAIRSWGSMTILVKRTPLRSSEINRIKNFASSRLFDLVYYPGIRIHETGRFIETQDNIYFTGFKKIISNGKPEEFLHRYIFDISPVHDDKPFFYYFLKSKNLNEIYHRVGEKWDFLLREGALLPFIFIQILFFSAILIALPFLFRGKVGMPGGANRPNKSIALYFAILGLGFMFVETALVQKLILVFTNPLTAVALVLASVLVGAGLGGAASSRFTFLQEPFSLLGLPILITLAMIWELPATVFLIPLSPAVKLPVIFAIILPLGFFLGLPFPSAMKSLGEHHPDFIPWAWAISGCFSVMGPVLAMMIALWMGFSSVLWIAGFLYLAAALLFASFKRRIRPGS